MKLVDKKSLRAELGTLNLNNGDKVLIFSDIVSVGRISEFQTREDYCSFYYNFIREKIGTKGTIIVPTYTPDVARYDHNFDRCFTKSQNGLFSEYVRCLDKSLRSDHPLNSVSAIGSDARLFCEGLGTSNFGWNSPFQKMHEADIKIISIGTCPGVSLGIAHYIEAICCLPYVYNKLLKWASFTNGIEDTRQFFATVRHLKLSYRLNYTQWSLKLSKLNHFQVSKFGASYIAQTEFGSAFKVAVRELSKNPYFFLSSKPNFVFGELPFDGATLKEEIKNSGGPINKLKEKLSYKSYLDPGIADILVT